MFKSNIAAIFELILHCLANIPILPQYCCNIGLLPGKGLKGNLLVWLYNCFQNRMITVRVNGRYSKKVAVNAGTLQGTALSLILFNLMSDLPDCSVVETPCLC